MKRMRCLATLILLCLTSFGCATFFVSKANLDQPPQGIRVYPPKLYLFVDQGQNKSHMLVAPDFERAYDVKPFTLFAKQDFSMEFSTDGLLTKVVSNQDTTSILSLFQKAAELGAAAAGVGISKETYDGTFGLPTGVYEYREGKFHQIQNESLKDPLISR